MADKMNLNQLGLSNEKLEGVDFDQIPDNLGQSYPDPPPPGAYRFKLPTDMSAIWSKVQSTDYGERIKAHFEDGAELTIVQSKDGAHNGEGFRWGVTNVPRERTKERILVSDMDLLLRGLGVTKKPGTNKAYAQELMKFAGKDFGAEVEYSWRCRDDKEIYVDDGAGGTQKVEGKMGCGARYYQRDVGKVNGVHPIRITCGNPECGASLRAFPQLTGFKA